MYILTHSNNLTRISCGDLLLESDERPKLPFAFDALYLEEPTALAFKVLAGVQHPLTDEEIAACKAFCDSFLETADYPVFAYDDAGVFVGSMRKSEAVQKALAFAFPEAPEHPSSKWNGEAWEKIRASILDDGSLILDPAQICERCTLALTAEEWAAFPKPPAVTDGEVYHWDFVAEAWKDVSDPLVFAFDEADAFVGQHRRSVAQSRGWGWHKTPPDGWPYKNTPTGWQRVEAVIYENGHYERLPGGIRDDAMLLFTREEWAAFPERPTAPEGYNPLWVWNFVTEAWKDISNPYGFAFELNCGGIEKEQAGLFVSDMFRDEAISKGLGFTLTRPEHPVSKWNGKTWERVVVVFMDDGSIQEQPNSLCDRCMIPLTATEWESWIKPERNIPSDLGSWNWNFARGVWEDRREINTLQYLITQSIYSKHKFDVNNIMKNPFELDELYLILNELNNWKSDPTIDTPFVNSCYPKIDRNKILEESKLRFTELSSKIGNLVKKRDSLIDEVKKCTNNKSLDTLYTHIQNFNELENKKV